MKELKSLNKHVSVYFVLSRQARTISVLLPFLPRRSRALALVCLGDAFLLGLLPSESLRHHSVSHNIWLLIQIQIKGDICEPHPLTSWSRKVFELCPVAAPVNIAGECCADGQTLGALPRVCQATQQSPGDVARYICHKSHYAQGPKTCCICKIYFLKNLQNLSTVRRVS